MISRYQLLSTSSQNGGAGSTHTSSPVQQVSVTMSLTTLPDTSKTLRGEHRYYSTSKRTPSLLPSTANQIRQAASSKSSHLDRNCAIALGLVALLILLVSSYVLQRHIKNTRRVEQQRRLSTVRSASPDPNPSFKMGSTWSKSAYTVRGKKRTSTVDVEKERRRESRVDSAATTVVGSIEEELHISSKSVMSRSPSPHSRTRTLSASSKGRSRHRRQSSVHGIPAAYFAEPRRTSSDGRRRGSTAQACRRISSLETIHEPETIDIEADKRGSRLYDWTRPGSVAEENTKIFGAVSSDSAQLHCVVPGVVPDCVSDEEEGGHEGVVLEDFRGVVWNTNSRLDKNKSAVNQDTGPAPDERDMEGVQRLDWAEQTASDGGRRRQTIG